MRVKSSLFILTALDAKGLIVVGVRCNKKTTAEKRFLITNPPPVLILHFKRFCYSNHGMPMKVNSPIAYAEQLDLKKYLSAKAVLFFHLFSCLDR